MEDKDLILHSLKTFKSIHTYVFLQTLSPLNFYFMRFTQVT